MEIIKKQEKIWRLEKLKNEPSAHLVVKVKGMSNSNHSYSIVNKNGEDTLRDIELPFHHEGPFN